MRRKLRSVISLGFLGLLLVTSCKKESDVPKDETATFLTSTNNLGSELSQTQTFNVLSDFVAKNPPIGTGKKTIRFRENEYKLPLNIVSETTKGTIEDLYGTWEWQDTGWVHIDPDVPQSGILFQWIFYDPAPHQAQILIDSIETCFIGTDTLPQKAHVAIYLDNNKITDLSFNAQYNNFSQITYLRILLTIPGEFQVGLEATNFEYNSEGEIVNVTLRLWIIDYTRSNFRTDLTITLRNDESIAFTYSDSDDWKVVLNLSAPVEIPEGYITYEKTTVTGEITKDGRHAADLRGVIWNPTDENHPTEITIIFSDGSEEPLQNYITFIGTK
ncbi:MAG TPA: hypothetical protein PKU94_01105 [Candidatus Hydrothermia bacterium]|nr:hypothetical protein [Candidatus Hydrothermia bacterium]